MHLKSTSGMEERYTLPHGVRTAPGHKTYEVVQSTRARAVATVGISVYRIYPPNIKPGKFLWSNNDVLMVIDLILHY